MIKFLVMDVDGTLTDGKIYMGSDGEIFKAFDIKDGCGIKDILPKFEIVPIIITARNSESLAKRCRELGILELYQGIRNKKEKLQKIIENYNYKQNASYSFANCAYIGDDILDIDCMQIIQDEGGWIGCPSDAVQEVKAIVDYICTKKAGEGAVREFISFLTDNFLEKSDLKERIDRAINYVSNVDVKNTPIGRYEIDENSYYIIQEYTTKNEIECRLESHRKYVDIQWIIEGEEEIDTRDIAALKVEQEYDEDNDVMFWKKTSRMQRVILRSNSYIILYPTDGHMPCVAVDKPMPIRKVVIKVKI